MKKDNLPKGVYINSSDNTVRAYWKENKKTKMKTFSINRYGIDEACKLAIEYRRIKEKELNINVDKVKNEYYFTKDTCILKISYIGFEQLVIFDKEDYEKINKYTWYIQGLKYNTPIVMGYLNTRCYNVKSVILNIQNSNNVIYLDGDNFNNRKMNLSVINTNDAANINRRKMASNNTSGKTGVIRHVIHGIPYYSAYAQHGKKLRKAFNINKLGEKKAYELACLARDKMNEELGIYNA